MSPLEKPQTFFYLMAIKALKNAEKVFKKFFFSLIAGPVTPPPSECHKKKKLRLPLPWSLECVEWDDLAPVLGHLGKVQALTTAATFIYGWQTKLNVSDTYPWHPDTSI